MTYLTPKWTSLFGLILILIGLYFEDTYDTTTMVLSLVLAMWLAIALHELGHIIFGKLSGFEFVFYIVGPFQFEKSTHGIRLKENKNWLFWGGVTMMTPTIQINKETITKKWPLFVAGGPFLSLLLGIISYVLYEHFSYMFLMYFAIINGVIFLATILPSKSSRTDGYVLLTLLKNNKDSTALIEDLLVGKELLSRRIPTEWDNECIKIAKEKTASLEHLQHAMLVYYYEIEKHGFQSAIKAMTEYSKIPVTKNNKVELAFLIHMQQLSRFLQDDVQVEQIERCQSLLTSIEPISFYRGRSIIAHLENDREAALKYLQKVKDITEENEALYGFFRAEKTLTNLVEEKIRKNIYE
ncbi:site-2 protease family protein [Paenibacillus senegalensis]|uniref:site-2 protease family protein n=1 Tax=Paenibacillus senegalensis TaxID=1465766 RepID=UPI0002883556|nr:site-2 protease family protein [Paenibacillus senegalensis]